MGGRGGASGLSAGKVSGPYADLHGAQSISEIVSVANDKYGIPLKESTLQGYNPDILKASVEDMHKLLEELPGIKPFLKVIVGKADSAMDGATADAGFEGTIRLNEKYYAGSVEDFQKAREQSEKFGYTPRGTGWKEVVIHELGHLAERAIIDKRSQSEWTKGDNWNKGTFAAKIIKQAADQIFKTDPKWAKMMKYADKNDIKRYRDRLVRDVSRYGSKSRSEALAECVSDYYRNRENANPLSIEVWKLLKKELG